MVQKENLKENEKEQLKPDRPCTHMYTIMVFMTSGTLSKFAITFLSVKRFLKLKLKLKTISNLTKTKARSESFSTKTLKL